jgi:hypothetical protein
MTPPPILSRLGWRALAAITFALGIALLLIALVVARS